MTLLPPPSGSSWHRVFFFVFFQSKEAKFHEFVHNDLPMGAAVLCAYPLLGTIIFGIFGIVYVLSFLISCWRVVSLVINKRLRFRVYTLGIAVLFAVSMQVLLLGISESWQPNDPIFEGLTFGMFLSVLACAVVAECILVIRPIADALALEAGMSSRLDSSSRFHRGVDVHVNTSSQLG
uniref:Uncharacterized protein n=1 Tax=Nelumbo nucifera TaxID=4432 RepID=A0A822YUE3_NELNU|nr:TPA_asm: hypothetical protein HUJ06_006770 [Nelumbo nucifera]